MKKRTTRFSIILSLLVMLLLAFCPAVYAGQSVSGTTSVAITTSGGFGTQIYLEGTVAPTIMSVTMPSNIMFDISKSNQGANKVLSPDIEIVNNSTQDVYIMTSNVYTSLYNMPGTVYATGVSGSAMYTTYGSITVQNNEIAIGLSDAPVTPGALGVNDLDSAIWLNTYFNQVMLTYLPATSTKTLHVVGTIGKDVPENSTFSVTPTLIATMYPYYY